MAGIHERAADREQTKRRQVLVRNAAADRGMRRIDKEKTH